MSMFRSPFGPSRQEIWRQLAAETDAAYVDGGFWKRDKVQARHGEWTVTLDTYAVSTGKVVIVYTRLRAPYVNSDGFRFTIYRRGLFSDIAKKLGMQDVEIGDEQFDRDFIIKGNDDGKLRSLFSSPTLRELIAGQPEILLTVKDHEGYFGPTFPEGTDELHYLVTGVIKDLDRLKRLYDLFAETLDQLCRIGSAYERDPGITL
ncbi:MAG: DUF3137 domain-containing protein [Acidobacteriota bacterium]